MLPAKPANVLRPLNRIKQQFHCETRTGAKGMRRAIGGNLVLAPGLVTGCLFDRRRDAIRRIDGKPSSVLRSIQHAWRENPRPRPRPPAPAACAPAAAAFR